MIKYEVKLKKIGEMTTLPDSQRLFGFLINNSKKYCSEVEISSFVRDVRERKQKCMISNLVPSGYYPTPKDLVMKNLQGRLKKNHEEIINFEKEQMELKSKSETIVENLIEKNNKKKANSAENKLGSEEKKKLNEELAELKSNLEEIKVCFNKNSEHINNISSKNIYETIKKMDFIDQSQLKEILKLGEDEGIIEVDDLLKFKYIKKNQTFIQKFRLENQIRQLPGLPNVAYSLPILSFENQEGYVQLYFSFFVKVMEGTCISKTLEAMKEITDGDENDMYGHKIPCFLGGKGSSGYNEYSIYNIEKLTESEDVIHSSVAASYLNMGMLLPDFDKIDAQNSLLDIHTSDRKPFEIENEVPKIISFVTAGSIIKLKQDKTDLYEIGRSIDNSKYNPMYNKNAIIFGNSYLYEIGGKLMKLKFTTISPIILSPRMEKALYKGVDFKEIDGKGKNLKLKKIDSINIVYPFYSYEDRDLLSEKNFSFVNNYYIPASSLKGGLFVGKKCEDDNMLRIKSVFRDINISKDYIELKNLYKFQYLYQKAGEIDTVGKDKDKQDLIYKTPKFEPFFSGVAIEMIGKGKMFETEILLKTEISEELFKKKLDESFSITKTKLENYIKEIELRKEDINLWIENGNLTQEEGKKEDFLIQLEEIQEKIKSLIDRKLLFLGGYKGILGSLTSQLDKSQKVQNGFYIDEETMLPYGLVEVFY